MADLQNQAGYDASGYQIDDRVGFQVVVQGAVQTWIISMLKNDNHCRVCGYELLEPPWGDDGCSPTWEICPCCGAEFGYEDCTPASARKKRETWISNGGEWFYLTMKPVNWSFNSQRLGIPDDFL